MRILVVGASGFIGQPLLARARLAVDAYGTSSSGARGLVPFQLERPQNFDFRLIRPGDVTIVTAAISQPDICSREFDRAWSINVLGTSHFIETALDHGARVIFLSTDAVYGERNDFFDETASCNPTGEYARMKRAVEEQFLGDSAFKVIRLSYVFAHNDRFSSYLADCAGRNVKAHVFHPFRRAIVHRDDVVQGALKLAMHWHLVPQQTINFGGPQLLSRVDFANCLRDAVYKNLRFNVTTPGSNFFSQRPKVIAMTSPLFARLLGRSPRRLPDAAVVEFSSNSAATEQL